MEDSLADEIRKAKELLYSVRHATMATVNENGTPLNTPFFFMYDKGLQKIYWGSHPNSQHSQNVLRTGQIFVVVYDAFKDGGLYIQAENGHPLEGKELDEGLRVHNNFRARYGKVPLEKSYYTGKSPQRMWSAEITNFWVSYAHRGSDGHMIKEYRKEITAKDLLD